MSLSLESNEAIFESLQSINHTKLDCCEDSKSIIVNFAKSLLG